ncbi:hypothetical protein KQ941_02850 [Paenibacillus xylanexedens]|uniref:hypothetical protein n=1 Tax=Paenibacillus xylanexedens TaxID=528191 RepID=UPI001F26AFE7|nr:hypothetical protein [Paenibacillus xylanexedens]MCF7753367.1 hypothetical protein [Paenibacillus xylanexedens]
MAYTTTAIIRHSGKRFEKGVPFPTTGLEKKDVDRLISIGAIVDPEQEAKALAKAEAAAKKAKEEE